MCINTTIVVTTQFSVVEEEQHTRSSKDRLYYVREETRTKGEREEICENVESTKKFNFNVTSCHTMPRRGAHSFQALTSKSIQVHLNAHKRCVLLYAPNVVCAT